MPLTPEERKAKVLAAGLDPNKFDFVEEDTTPTWESALNPAVIENNSNPELTAMDAVKARAKRAIVPGLAALPGMGYGASIGSALGPIGTVAGGIVGGLVTGGAGSVAQEPLLKYVQGEDAYNKGLEQYNRAAQEFPKLSTGVDVAASAITGFRPSVSGLRGIGRMAVGVPFNKLAVSEGENLLSAGINSGVGAGMEAIHQGVSEEEFNPGRIATAGLVSSLFNKPNFPAIRALGGSGGVKSGLDTSVETSPASINQEPTAPILKFEPTEFSDLENQYQQKIKDDEFNRQMLEIKKQKADEASVENKFKSYQTKLRQKQLAAGEIPDGDPTYEAGVEDAVFPKVDPKQVDLRLADEALPKRSPIEEPDLTIDPNKQIPAKTGGPVISGEPKEQGIPYERQLENLRNEFKAEIAQVKQAATATKPAATSKELLPSEVPVESITKPEKVTDAGDEFLANINKEKTDNKYYQPADENVEPKLDNLTNEDKSFARDFANKRGVTLKEGGEVLNPATGQRVRGYSDPAAREAGITDIATRDTAPHELGGHQYFEDLLQSKLQADRVFAEKGIRAAGSKEALAESVGKRIVDIEDAPLKSWLQDFWSNTKRLARLSGDEDQIKLAARRARDDKPFNESPEFSHLKPEPKSKLPDGVIPFKTGGETESKSEVYYSEKGEGVKDKKAPSNGIPGIKPVLEQLREHSPEGAKVSKAFENFLDLQRGYSGLSNKATAAADKIKDKAAAIQWMHDMVNFGSSKVKLTPHDAGRVNQLREPLLEINKIRRAEGLTPKGVGERDNPNYFPQMIDQSVLDTFAKGAQPAKDKLRSEYIAHVQKKDPSMTTAEATELLDTYLKNVNNPSGQQTPEFKALREHAGKGIPHSWMEKDPARLMQRYFNNTARDLAYFKSVQKDPELRSLFNVPDVNGSTEKNAKGIQPVTHPHIKLLYKQMAGESTVQEGTQRAIEHGLRSTILGPVTGAANMVSAVVHAMPYIPVKDMPAIIKAAQYIQKGFVDSMDMGVNRYHITDIESGARLGVSYYADKIKELGDIVRKYTGTTLIEQYSRAHTMMTGELVAQASWGRALKGDNDGMAFLRKFGSDGFDYKTKPISRDEILKIAANFTERVQGSYGAKGLPSYLLEPSTPAYWLLSLNKWSVERANIIKSDVINPALKGDVGPLLKYTVGALLGGTAINELRELANNKKSNIPTTEELAKEGDAKDYAYKITAILNAAGFAGILGDAAKAIQDKLNKNRVNVPNSLAVDLSAETVGNFMDATAAVAEGQSPVETYLNFALDTVVNSTQALRVIANNTYKADDNERSDSYRDLRTYKKLTDQPVGDTSGLNPNHYIDNDVKEFKQSKTVEEGVRILKDKILPRLNKLSPDARKQKLEGIRRNSYQTIPANPIEARKYYEFVVATQGKEKADSLFKDHASQKLVNIQKSAKVPRF